MKLKTTRFKDGQFLKSADKEKIAKAFARFVKGGFQKTQFTNSLYKHLSLHFGFIAHYNLDGFYVARFEDPQGRVQTLQSICNASAWTFKDENTSGTADLNEYIRDVVVSNYVQVEKEAKAEYKSQICNKISSLQTELKNLE